MEPVYRFLEVTAESLVAATGTQITFGGLENIPASGPAVVAINHTSYVDWLPAALAVKRRGRRMRFMIKAEMQQVKVVNFLIKRTRTIPVDRSHGSQAYTVAVQRLREGELVGVYPEATISRSFELKDFKSGAARMALEAQVPVVPLIVWGTQQIWTKGHPKQLGRKKFPVTVQAGPALAPVGSAAELEDTMRAAMSAVLTEAQRHHPRPPGAHWLPARLGGTAPTPEEATLLDQAERARRQADGG